MERQTVGRSVGFRPSGQVAAWLDYAERLGINRSSLIQEVMEESLGVLKEKIETRKRELLQALKNPAPA